MRYAKCLMLLGAVITTMTVGCDRMGDDRVQIGVITPVTFPIMAGQNTDVGDVTVWNDGTNLYVKYVIDVAGWSLTETQVAVALNYSGLPQTKTGNPKVGNFTYKSTHANATEYTYTIPLTWEVGTTLAIAAHCAVVRVVNGQVVQTETGWSGDHDFLGANWAKWFEYTIDSDDEIEYQTETAWGGDIGVNVGSPGAWYYYTTYTVGSAEKQVDLWAGQYHDCGRVNIWTDGDYIKVRFTCEPSADYDWIYFHELYVELGLTLEEVVGGNPRPVSGSFTWKLEGSEPVVAYTFSIPVVGSRHVHIQGPNWQDVPYDYTGATVYVFTHANATYQY